jgi:hypothetical protein
MHTKWAIESTAYIMQLKRGKSADGIHELVKLAEQVRDEYDAAMTPEVVDAVTRATPATVGGRCFASYHQAARVFIEAVLFAADGVKTDDAEQAIRDTREGNDLPVEEVLAGVQIEHKAAAAPGEPSSGRTKGGRLKKGEANKIVGEFIELKERPDLTLAEVHDGTGLAKSTISSTAIWKEYDARAKELRDLNAAALRNAPERW